MFVRVCCVISWEVHLFHHISDEEGRRLVDNEVFLFLQEELEGMASCLETFGLPTPDKQNRIQRIPKVIADEMFSKEQIEISNSKYEQLNIDQQEAFCTIMKAVHDNEHPQRLFFLNVPGGYGKTLH